MYRDADFYNFYLLGLVLGRIPVLKGTPNLDNRLNIVINAQMYLPCVFNSPLEIPHSKAAARELLAALDWSVDIIRPGKEEEVVENIERMTSALNSFNEILGAEVGSLHFYHVPQDGIYSVHELIKNADAVLSEQCRRIISQQAIDDLRQGGRCIVFDLPTAAGFHLMRALEMVLIQYYFVYVGKVPKEHDRSWGRYISELRSKDLGADLKTLDLMDHIRKHHRNPVVHPETNLDKDEALEILGIAPMAISSMVKDILACCTRKGLSDVPMPPMLNE